MVLIDIDCVWRLCYTHCRASKPLKASEKQSVMCPGLQQQLVPCADCVSWS